MTEKPSTPARAPDEIDEEFFETLRAAAFVFEKEQHGGFTGLPMACRAVARYILRRGRAAELAGPFL